jgi:hypothetical protein
MRRSVAQKVIAAQEKAPVTAWVIWVGAMAALGYHVAEHGKLIEDWKDGVLVGLCIVAAPGFVKYAAGNAERIIGLYRAFRAAKKDSGKEDRESGSGGQS